MQKDTYLVMVIEDEEALLQAIAQKLTNTGFKIITCTSATQAIGYLKELQKLPDIIWLDYYLEDMNGLEFMEKLGENTEWKKIPVIVVSNSASPQKVKAMLEKGAKKYLLKADYKLKEIADIMRDYLPGGESVMKTEKKKILIIDDEIPIATALNKKLSDEGFDVTIADDGKVGLQKALTEAPDLILLDIVMPAMDGITLLEKLREDDNGKKIPVIVLTNLDESEKVEQSRRNGVNDYLVKTAWTLEDIIQKVRNKVEGN